MYIGDLGKTKLTPDQETMLKELKHYFKEQRGVIKSHKDRVAAGVNKATQQKALKELRARFDAGEDVDLLALSESFPVTTTGATPAATTASAGGIGKFLPLALGVAAAYLMS